MSTKKTEQDFIDERNEKMKKAANAVTRIRMLKDGKDNQGNKLTAGRVYEVNDDVPESLVKDELAEYIEVERDPAHESESIIADPDMSQNERPVDAVRPEPDMSRRRTLDTVGAKSPEEVAAEELEEVEEEVEEEDPEQPGVKRKVKRKAKRKKK